MIPFTDSSKNVGLRLCVPVWVVVFFHPFTGFQPGINGKSSPSQSAGFYPGLLGRTA